MDDVNVAERSHVMQQASRDPYSTSSSSSSSSSSSALPSPTSPRDSSSRGKNNNTNSHAPSAGPRYVPGSVSDPMNEEGSESSAPPVRAYVGVMLYYVML